MAIYHLSVKPVARSAGRSATAAAAYRAAEKVHDHSTDQVFDYSRKRGVEHAEIVLPTEAARQDINWARDRTALWNAAEAAEKRKDARVAREYELALPHELSKTQRVTLVRAFATDIANRYGVAVDFAIHAPHREGDDRNHHAHVLTTTREVTATGLGAKTDIELGDRDRAKKGLGRAAEEIVSIRSRWAELTNEHLQELGVDARVDHRSLRDQGIEREPGTHLGVAVSGMERRGIETEVGNRIRAEQALEAQQRLERAAELGRLERERALVERSILDLSGDLQAAKSERDKGLERGSEKVSAPERRRGMFDGLVLNAAPVTEPKAVITDRGKHAEIQPLDRALDRYARAWGEVAQMHELKMPVLEHQKIALKERRQELDAIRPEAGADIRRAVLHEPGAYQAMRELKGPERTQAMRGMLEHEEQVRADPRLRAVRVLTMWNGLEKEYEATRDWRKADEHKQVKGQMQDLVMELKRDPQLESLLRNRQREYGIDPGSRLDEILRERNLTRALDIDVWERSRSLGLGR